MMAGPVARARGMDRKITVDTISKVVGVRKRCLPISTPRQRRFFNEKDTTFYAGVQAGASGEVQGSGAEPPSRAGSPPVLLDLLDFDGCDAFELLGDGGRVILRDVLLQGLRRAVDQVLGFLQAEGGDFANSLDGGDLVRAGILEDDGELGLLFGGRGCCRSAPAR